MYLKSALLTGLLLQKSPRNLGSLLIDIYETWLIHMCDISRLFTCTLYHISMPFLQKRPRYVRSHASYQISMAFLQKRHKCLVSHTSYHMSKLLLRKRPRNFREPYITSHIDSSLQKRPRYTGSHTSYNISMSFLQHRPSNLESHTSEPYIASHVDVSFLKET